MRSFWLILLPGLVGWVCAPAEVQAPTEPWPRPAGLLADVRTPSIALYRANGLHQDSTVVAAETAAAFVGGIGMLGLIRRRRKGIAKRAPIRRC